MSEDCVCFVGEGATAILREISLIDPIAAVSDRAVRTAAGTLDAVMPADLLQQIRCGRFRHESVHWEHIGTADAVPLFSLTFSTALPINNRLCLITSGQRITS